MCFSLRSFVFAAAFAVVLVTSPLISRGSPDSPQDNGIAITRVYTGWKEGASFRRISEYFSGKENTGGTIVLRTHPDQRSGFYFLVRASNPHAPMAVKIKLELITPTDTKPKTYTFSTDLKSGQNLLSLGLTGDDWADAKANPVAWKIDFLGTGDSLLATEKSYLWERPVAK